MKMKELSVKVEINLQVPKAFLNKDTRHLESVIIIAIHFTKAHR